MVSTYMMKIDKNIGKDRFDKLMCFITLEKRERIDRFYRFEDAQRSLLGDVLARYAICKELGCVNSDLVFGANEYGKPVLHEPSGIDFNISHSGNWVVCAVDKNAVGIDVEKIKPIDLKIAQRFFTRDEYISLMEQPQEMKLKYFYILWTLKESYIKMEGKGLCIPLSSFTIKIKGNYISVLVDDKIQQCFMNWFIMDNTVVCSVCTQNDHNKEIVYWNNQENLFKEVKRHCL